MSDPTTTTDTARHLIRDRGLRATAGRVAVLALLMEHGVPMSHAEVFETLRGSQWDRTTIYRNLVDMAEVGILHRSELGDRVWRFEYLADEHDPTSHPHFVCTDCGTVECLTDFNMPPTAPARDPKEGHVPVSLLQGDVEVTFRGQCDTCRDI